jgi:hypothetical protein
MIKIAIRFEDDMVMVFDSHGRQMPRYHGRYEDVKMSILNEAPHNTVFAYAFTGSRGIKRVPREEW